MWQVEKILELIWKKEKDEKEKEEKEEKEVRERQVFKIRAWVGRVSMHGLACAMNERKEKKRNYQNKVEMKCVT